MVGRRRCNSRAAGNMFFGRPANDAYKPPEPKIIKRLSLLPKEKRQYEKIPLDIVLMIKHLDFEVGRQNYETYDQLDLDMLKCVSKYESIKIALLVYGHGRFNCADIDGGLIREISGEIMSVMGK